MTNSIQEKGFIGVVVLVFVLVLIIIGAVYASHFRISSIDPNSSSSNSATELLSPSPTPADQIYTDQDLGFSFNYPATGYMIVSDNEDKYKALSGADQRKNFYQTWWYEPPTLIKGLYVKPDSLKDMNQFTPLPFTVWVFDNPNNLTPNQWYEKYWYYPFLWGDYEPRKEQDGPNKQATISGQAAAYKIVTFQLGNPQFIYIPTNGKMFLIRAFDDASTDGQSSKILASFKLN